MAQLINTTRTKNNPAWIPLLYAAGADNTLTNKALEAPTISTLLQWYNGVVASNAKLPMLSKSDFYQYIADRQGAGGLDDVAIILDPNEELPAPIVRPDAPTLSRSGNTITIDAPITNVPTLATETQLHLYINRVLKASDTRDLTNPTQRSFSIAGWGLNGDENIQILIEDSGTYGWPGIVDLASS